MAHTPRSKRPRRVLITYGSALVRGRAASGQAAGRRRADTRAALPAAGVRPSGLAAPDSPTGTGFASPQARLTFPRVHARRHRLAQKPLLPPSRTETSRRVRIAGAFMRIAHSALRRRWRNGPAAAALPCRRRHVARRRGAKRQPAALERRGHGTGMPVKEWHDPDGGEQRTRVGCAGASRISAAPPPPRRSGRHR